MAIRGVGTRNIPTSPLQLGVADPEQLLKIARKIRRSQSFPALCEHDQLGGSSHSAVLGKEEASSWLKPIIPDSSFQVFTNPQSFRKSKTTSPGKIPLFQLKLGKNPFQPSSSQTSSSSKSVSPKNGSPKSAHRHDGPDGCRQICTIGLALAFKCTA